MSASTTLRKVGGFGRLSSSLVSGTLFSSAPAPDPRLTVAAAAESVLRSALAKLMKTLYSKKYKNIRDEAQKQMDLLEKLVNDVNPSPSSSAPPSLPQLDASTNSLHVSMYDQSNGHHLNKFESSRSGPLLQEHALAFFNVFKLACESGSSKVILAALDGLQKLLACGFLSGVACPESVIEIEDELTLPGEAKQSDFPVDFVFQTSPPLLIDQTVDVIVKCGDIADDAIHLQMIRCLLTAVTSIQCKDLHGHSLTAAFKAVFKIFGEDRDQQNQRTAQAALTQMVNVVMRRFESSSQQSYVEPNEQGEQSTPSPARPSVPSPSARLGDTADNSLEYQNFLDQWIDVRLSHLVDEVTFETSSKPIKDTNFNRLCIICHKPVSHLCIQTNDPLCSSNECKQINQELNDKIDVSDKWTAQSVPLSPETTTKSPDKNSLAYTTNQQLKQDAFLVFHALCKLSMHDVDAAHPSNEQRLIRCKRLSLELILSMLQTSGIAFRMDKNILHVIKSLLCISLIENCVSHIPRIFGLSLSIFILLTTHLKDHLRTEISVFVDQILLRILESSNSSYEHKHRVLQVFHKLCSDPLVTLELYLNFDCDVEEKDVFGRVVDCLANIAQGKFTSVEKTPLILPEQQQILRQMALESLVVLMSSMQDWVIKCQTEADNQSKIDREETTERSSEVLMHAVMNSKLTAETTKDNNNHNTENADPLPQTNHELMIQQRQRKLIFQEGIALFNSNPQQGLEFLIKEGYVENSPNKVATFFLRCNGLGKQQVGQFLGEEHPFNQQVLHEVVDQLDFQDLEIDFALRKFLSTFRLPGEAQKIDRMMEKFAEKYYKDNPGKFSTADCAYILAFSLIMLHTDAHSKSIKPEYKMTAEVFVRNNRGINDNEDLSSEYLESLYNRIVAEEWVMEEDIDQRVALEVNQAQHQLESLALALGLAVPSAGRRKFELFLKESKGMVTKVTEMMKRKGKEPYTSLLANTTRRQYIVATPDMCGQVAFLFKAVCMPLLVLIKTEELPQCLQLLLKGYLVCVRVAARFDMVAEVELFVSSLAKFTGLTFASSPSETLLTPKNIEAMQAVFQIALTESNCLGTSWKFVLECTSSLHHLSLVNSGCMHDDLLLASSAELLDATQRLAKDSESLEITMLTQTTTSATSPIASSSPDVSIGRSSVQVATDNETLRTIEHINSTLILQELDLTALDLLFSRSKSLSSSGIVSFVACLCEVSENELQRSIPRIFSLQKLVEVADYNMNRIRIIWSKIWSILRKHFVAAALHSNYAICLYAVDSLRQLAMKFLEKDELSNYAFQVEFLKPLQIVMLDPRTVPDIKEFIVQIISNMIKARSANIKSGWKMVLNILNAATIVSSGSTQCLVRRSRLALDVVELILLEHFWTILDHFGETTRCLLSFGLLQCKEDEEGAEAALKISIESLRYLEALAVALAGVDYSTYLTSEYPDCENVRIISTDVSKLSVTELSSENLQSEKFIGILKGSMAESHLTMMLRLKEAEATLIEIEGKGENSQVAADQIESAKRNLRVSQQDFQQHLSGYWLPIFTGLAQLSTAPTAQNPVKNDALKALFRLLVDFGTTHLNRDMWQMTIRGVLFPLFDDIHLQFQHLPSNIQPPPPPSEQKMGIDTKSSLRKQSLKPTIPIILASNRPAAVPPKALATYSNKLDSPSRSNSVDGNAGVRCWSALVHLINLVDKRFECLKVFLPEILMLFSSCINNQPEAVARLGVEALKDLLLQVAARCGVNEWTKITCCLVTLFSKTCPRDLIMPAMPKEQNQSPRREGNSISEGVAQIQQSSRKGHDDGDATLFKDDVSIKTEETVKALPFQPHEVVTQCVVQLLLIDLTQIVVSERHMHMPPSCVDLSLVCLKSTFTFARAFNRQVEWRHRLKCLGFMREMRQLPGLLKQEREGLTSFLTLLFTLLSSDINNRPLAEVQTTEAFYSDCIKSLDVYSLAASIERKEEDLTPKALDRKQFLLMTCREVIDQYLERQLSQQPRASGTISSDGPKTLSQLIQIESEREASGLTPIFLNVMLEGFSELPKKAFDSIASEIFSLLIDLTLSDSKSLRQAVRDLMKRKFTALLSK